MRHRITQAKIIAVLAVMTCLTAESILRAGEATTPPGGSRLRITMANQAGARDADLGRARSAVTYELTRIGIDVVWTVEGRAQATTLSSATQRTQSTERSFMLILLSSDTAAKLARNASDQLLGVALPPASRAYLFYDRIERVAQVAGVSIHEPLSYVMLHEIGHLLLSGGHSELGLMQAMLPKLGVATFRQFTRDQETRLRLATRIGAPVDLPILTASAGRP